jgi:hypothetical protein
VGWAEHRQPTSITLLEQLARDESSLDRLPDADVVGDEETHRIQAQRHEQGHELIRPRLDGDRPD